MHLTKKEAEALLPMLRKFCAAVDDDLERYILARLMKKLEAVKTNS